MMNRDEEIKRIEDIGVELTEEELRQRLDNAFNRRNA